MKKSYVYIITDGEDYKVGVSDNPGKRLKQLQTGNPKKLRIVSTFTLPEKSTAFKVERESHTKIGALYEKRGEWFKGASEFHINLIVDTAFMRFTESVMDYNPESDQYLKRSPQKVDESDQ
jgi:predicted GIY-YIG superfamily endonuclease